MLVARVAVALLKWIELAVELIVDSLSDWDEAVLEIELANGIHWTRDRNAALATN